MLSDLHDGPIGDLPKIPKKPVVVVPLRDRFSMKNQEEYLQIYGGLSVLIIGESSMRVLYLDLCTMLAKGCCLCDGDAARQRGVKSNIPGEVLLSVSGRVGADDYREVRMFKVVDSSTTITFVFIASLFNGNVITSVPSCGDASSARPYDVIMCCSYMSDMNSRKVKESGVETDAYHVKYRDSLDKFLVDLVRLYGGKVNKGKTAFVWLTPTPKDLSMIEQTIEEFLKLSKMTDTVVERHGFHVIDRLDHWLKNGQELVVRKTGNFSPFGIRSINDDVLNFVATHFNKTYRPFVQQPCPTPIQALRASWAAGWRTKERPVPVDHRKMKRLQRLPGRKR